MTDLKTIIQNCYEYVNYGYNNPTCYSAASGSPFAYLSIPIQGDVIEIPTFAMYAFAIKDLKENQESIDAIVVGLNSTAYSDYKSIDAKIRDSLSSDYNCRHLTKIVVNDPQNPCYYCAKGAIFNKDLIPQIMMTWQMKRIKDANSTNETWKYLAVRPILRINPSVIINKDNAVERYIVNKIVPMAVSIYGVEGPFIHVNPSIIKDTYNRLTIKVEIDKFPFKFNKVDKPSISTTNEKLLKVALDNVDEMIL